MDTMWYATLDGVCTMGELIEVCNKKCDWNGEPFKPNEYLLEWAWWEGPYSDKSVAESRLLSNADWD